MLMSENAVAIDILQGGGGDGEDDDEGNEHSGLIASAESASSAAARPGRNGAADTATSLWTMTTFAMPLTTVWRLLATASKKNP